MIRADDVLKVTRPTAQASLWGQRVLLQRNHAPLCHNVATTRWISDGIYPLNTAGNCMELSPAEALSVLAFLRDNEDELKRLGENEQRELDEARKRIVEGLS